MLTSNEQDKEAERLFFNRFDREGGYNRFDEKSYSKLLHYFEVSADPREGETIVDMGCGTGAFSQQLAHAYPQCKVEGIDLSEGSIKRASQNYPKVRFRIGDIERTDLSSSSVDVVCFSGILHHFPDFSRVACETFRILKPGGRFFSFDPHHYNPAFWLYRSRSSPFYSSEGVTPNERLMTTREIRQVFQSAGFNANAYVTSGITFGSSASLLATKLWSLYNTLDLLLAATPLSRLIGAWVIGYGQKPKT